MNEVDRYRWGDRGMRVGGGRNHAGAEKYAQSGFPTVFNRWREGEHLAGAGVEEDAGRILQTVISSHVCVPVVAVGGIEGSTQLRVTLYSQDGSTRKELPGLAFPRKPDAVP